MHQRHSMMIFTDKIPNNHKNLLSSTAMHNQGTQSMLCSQAVLYNMDMRMHFIEADSTRSVVFQSPALVWNHETEVVGCQPCFFLLEQTMCAHLQQPMIQELVRHSLACQFQRSVKRHPQKLEVDLQRTQQGLVGCRKQHGGNRQQSFHSAGFLCSSRYEYQMKRVVGNLIFQKSSKRMRELSFKYFSLHAEQFQASWLDYIATSNVLKSVNRYHTII